MRIVAVVAGLALLAAIAWLGSSGLLGELTERERIVGLLGRLGPLGPVLFVALVLALFPVFLIGPPIWSAAAVWPPLEALAYSSFACILASLLCYCLARSLGREWAQQRIPAKVRRYEDRLVAHPLRTMLLLRVLLWANPAVDLLIGVSRVTTRDYLIGTFVGLIPVTAFHVLVVGRGFQLALALPGWVWVALGVPLAAAFAARSLRRTRRAAAATGPLGDP